MVDQWMRCCGIGSKVPIVTEAMCTVKPKGTIGFPRDPQFTAEGAHANGGRKTAAATVGTGNATSSVNACE